MNGLRPKAAETRERIVAEAARRFRARGFAGVGVAELMGGIGLTHGGFYAHFASKEELMALACRRAVADMLALWRARAASAPDDPLGAIVGPYLSAAHRDAPETGCLMAALGPDAARQGEAVRRAVGECLEDVLDMLAGHMPEATAAQRRKAAIRLFATLVGTLVAARAVEDAALSDELLGSVAQALSRPGRADQAGPGTVAGEP